MSLCVNVVIVFSENTEFPSFPQPQTKTLCFTKRFDGNREVNSTNTVRYCICTVFQARTE